MISTASLKFQFHEGPIKTSARRWRYCSQWVFQFHEGPIKTGYVIEALRSEVKFQFHEGPIKTRYNDVNPDACWCFNSMKVRLKLQGQKPDYKDV